MNLSQRDKKLLILLAIVAFLAIYIKFLFLPKLDSINDLNSQITTLDDAYSVNMNYKAMVNSIDSEIKIITQRLNDLRQIYPPNINCEELLVLIKQVSDDSGINLSSISFTPIQVAKFDNDTGTPSEGQLQTSMPASDLGNQLVEQKSQQVTNTIEDKIAYYFNMLGLVPEKNSTGQL